MDIKEVNSTLLELENAQTTYSTCEKIAILSMCKKYMDEKNSQPGTASEYSSAAAPESDFAKIVRAAPFGRVLSVLDEHMMVIKALYPKEYESVCSKIKSL